jgi:hypothetical protein
VPPVLLSSLYHKYDLSKVIPESSSCCMPNAGQDQEHPGPRCPHLCPTVSQGCGRVLTGQRRLSVQGSLSRCGRDACRWVGIKGSRSDGKGRVQILVPQLHMCRADQQARTMNRNVDSTVHLLLRKPSRRHLFMNWLQACTLSIVLTLSMCDLCHRHLLMNWLQACTLSIV